MSAFSTVVGRLSDLSESELRQLYLIVGVRLGNPDGASAGGTRQGRSKSTAKNQSGKASTGSGSSTKGGKKSGKGNPSRKSQWETHPKYREYKRLKKVVETQAKELKTPFASVDTPERSAYNSALEQWLEAKSTFRDRGNTAAESEEASSSKGKGKAPQGGAPDTSVQPTPTDKVGPSKSWAEQAQEEADGDSSSGEDEDLPDAPETPAPVAGASGSGSQPIVDRRKTPVHDKPTPPKNSGAGKKTRT